VGFGYQKEKVVEESFLLTGDENIIDVAFAVQYQVKDPMAYAFGVVDPDAVVRSVTVSALRAIIGTLTVDVTYTSGRDEIARAARQVVQDKLDAYAMGCTWSASACSACTHRPRCTRRSATWPAPRRTGS
jgi:membrane protease subunit HflK